jgi:N6-L-threonylcarbamoyladenine synthase
MMSAKAIALAKKLPFIAVNHLEGHGLSPGLMEGVRPPYLLLLISGGHTQIVSVEGVGDFTRYGTTIDDALGEAFDKVAKMLDLGYPGGPVVEKMALKGDATRFALPRPMKGRKGCHFSFSGLKTAVRTAAMKLECVSEQDKADICASFQQAVADTLADRLDHACAQFAASHPGLADKILVVAGGVAANAALRESINKAVAAHGFRLIAPPAHMCTDNAAMIAWAGAERLARGLVDPLNTPARARWPLDPDAEPAAYAGVKA